MSDTPHTDDLLRKMRAINHPTSPQPVTDLLLKLDDLIRDLKDA